MTDKEKLSCLTDRPCQVCKHKKENGCCKWSCVFEEESESTDIEKIRTEIIQDVQNGVIQITKGSDRLFEIIDKYIAENE